MGAPKNNCNNPFGRPPKAFDHELFEKLCYIHCSGAEIAGIMRMDLDTLYVKVKDYYNVDFSEAYARLAANGKASLRRIQFELAKKNPSMAIFLGKNYLGQKESPVEYIVPQEFIQPFDSLMGQIKNLQSERKKDESTNKSE